jgi:hypothetical protein
MRLILGAIISGVAAELAGQLGDEIDKRRADRRRFFKQASEIRELEYGLSRARKRLNALENAVAEQQTELETIREWKGDGLVMLINQALPAGYVAEREGDGIRWRHGDDFGAINRGDPRDTITDAWRHVRAACAACEAQT